MHTYMHSRLLNPNPFPSTPQNPCLTFVTPTLLAGDRSLTNVVAHEASLSMTHISAILAEADYYRAGAEGIR